MSPGQVLVTGGAGYIGAAVCRELREAGHEVRLLDSMRHEQHDVARQLERLGVDLIRADLRDQAARSDALAGATAVIHLAAIVGDPACALEPELAQEINVAASHGLLADAEHAGVGRLVFASTCSNYGIAADPDIALDEGSPLAPASLYARQKVEVERALIDWPPDRMDAVCLRIATVYGVAPRMRFDLTVNEFTRDLWADRELEVYGADHWRPFVHVRDVARAIRMATDAPGRALTHRVVNVGSTDENYRKLDVVEEVRRQLGRGRVRFVEGPTDPRDYRVSFDRIRRAWGFEPEWSMRRGIAELLSELECGRYEDPFHRRYRNIP